MLLLQRRRAGLISDARLMIAAYLGDPIARALRSDQRPDEAALHAALAARFFAGAAQEVEELWRGLLDDDGLPEEIAALVRLAAREPRLRRLAPGLDRQAIGFLNSTAHPASLGLWITCVPEGPRDQGSESLWRYRLGRRGQLGLALEGGRGAEDAVAMVLTLLPAEDRPVWLGSGEALPRARAELGGYNDDLGLEAWLDGLGAFDDQELPYRVALALAPELSERWRRVRPKSGVLDELFAALAAWVLAPSAGHARRARRAILAAQLLSRGGDTGLARTEVQIAAGFARLPANKSLLQDALRSLEPDLIKERIQAAMIPWALGDPDPLFAFRERFPGQGEGGSEAPC